MLQRPKLQPLPQAQHQPWGSWGGGWWGGSGSGNGGSGSGHGGSGSGNGGSGSGHGGSGSGHGGSGGGSGSGPGDSGSGRGSQDQQGSASGDAPEWKAMLLRLEQTLVLSMKASGLESLITSGNLCIGVMLRCFNCVSGE